MSMERCLARVWHGRVVLHRFRLAALRCNLTQQMTQQTCCASTNAGAVRSSAQLSQGWAHDRGHPRFLSAISVAQWAWASLRRRADSAVLVDESPPIADPPGPGPTAASSAPAAGDGAEHMRQHALRR